MDGVWRSVFVIGCTGEWAGHRSVLENTPRMRANRKEALRRVFSSLSPIVKVSFLVPENMKIED